jgi:hypothetical protein
MMSKTAPAKLNPQKNLRPWTYDKAHAGICRKLLLDILQIATSERVDSCTGNKRSFFCWLSQKLKDGKFNEQADQD